MKKGVIISMFIVVLLFLLILLFGEKYETEIKEDNFSKVVKILTNKPTDEELETRKKEIEEKIKSGEDIVENVEIEDGYIELAIYVKDQEDIYYLGYKGDKNIGMIVEGISQILGYKMDVNKIKIGSKTVKIDFDEGFLKERVITENYKNYEISQENIQEIVLNSVTKAIMENYENIEKVVYSVSGKKIK